VSEGIIEVFEPVDHNGIRYGIRIEADDMKDYRYNIHRRRIGLAKTARRRKA
jgi:hypothetical protein